MAYSISFKINSSDQLSKDTVYDKALAGLQNKLNGELTSGRRKQLFTQDSENVVELAKDNDRVFLRVTLIAADQAGAQRQLEAFLEQFSRTEKKQLLENITVQQREKSSQKAFMERIKADFSNSLIQDVEQQNAPLTTGQNRTLATQLQQRRHSAPGFVPTQSQGISLTADGGRPDVDMKALKGCFRAFLEKELKERNKDVAENDQFIYDVAYKDALMVFSLKNKSEDNSLQVTLDNGFHAKANIVNNENVAMLVLSAKAYLKARQESSPEAGFNGFVLTCETMEQALVLRQQFKQEGIALQNILISKAKEDEPRFLKPALIEHSPQPSLEKDMPTTERSKRTRAVTIN